MAHCWTPAPTPPLVFVITSSVGKSAEEGETGHVDVPWVRIWDVWAVSPPARCPAGYLTHQLLPLLLELCLNALNTLCASCISIWSVGLFVFDDSWESVEAIIASK